MIHKYLIEHGAMDLNTTTRLAYFSQHQQTTDWVVDGWFGVKMESWFGTSNRPQNVYYYIEGHCRCQHGS